MEKNSFAELPNKDKRPFYIGHSSVKRPKSLPETDFQMESLNALIDFQIVPTLPTGSIKKIA